MNKIWNIHIFEYKGYFNIKSVPGTEIKNFRRDHIWCFLCRYDKILSIDISQYKVYFSSNSVLGTEILVGSSLFPYPGLTCVLK